MAERGGNGGGESSRQGMSLSPVPRLSVEAVR